MDLNFNNCGCLSKLKMENVSLALLAFIHWPLRIAINKAERQTSTWSGNLTLVKSVFSYRSPTGTDPAVKVCLSSLGRFL